MIDADYAARVHPAHKKAVPGKPLTCVCGRPFATATALHLHQLTPWLSGHQLVTGRGAVDA